MNEPQQYLADFLERNVTIPAGIRSRASTSQKALRDLIVGEYSRDATFPRVLQQRDSDFIGGSFARHTKIWPLDDIDIYFPIDGSALVYYTGGSPTNVVVVTDGSMSGNPVLYAKWMTGDFVSSARLTEGFRTVAKRRYPDTVIQPADEAVSIQTTIGASASSEGLNFDAVPCFVLEQPGVPYRVYLIPDGNNRWIKTNPRIDEQLCAELQQWHWDLYRPAVRLVKYWEKDLLGGLLGSYYTELACSIRFLALKNSGMRHITITNATADAFAAVAQAALGGDQRSFVTSAPAVSPKQALSQRTLQMLSATASNAQAAVQFENLGLNVRATNAWREVLGE